LPNADNAILDVAVGSFELCYGPFWLYDWPFWTTQWAVLDNFLGIIIFGSLLAMGRFGIAPRITCVIVANAQLSNSV